MSKKGMDCDLTERVTGYGFLVVKRENNWELRFFLQRDTGKEMEGKWVEGNGCRE